MTKPSEWIEDRAKGYKIGFSLFNKKSKSIVAIECRIQAILDYLDRPTLKEDCFRCHGLPEGVVIKGHNHKS